MAPPSRVIYSLLLFIVLSLPATALAGATTLYDSVQRALKSNPQLQVLDHEREALERDLEQSRGGYLPTVDMSLGRGVEQYSDTVTRRPGAEPANTDWDSLTDASLRLTQKIYDGGETKSKVSIQKALLGSANYYHRAKAQAIAVDAVTAHLHVFLQRDLVDLAEKNLKFHEDISQLLTERERAGAGNIADVTQARGRLSHAQSNLYLIQGDLNEAIAHYTQVIGTPPEDLAFGGGPKTLPQTLKEALQQVEKGNPELLALDAEIVEADSKLNLARSKYKPTLALELSSGYSDQLEGDQSWQRTNEAMLYLRWNLFNGGQDKAGVNAALSRRRESRSKRAAKLVELRAAAATAWGNYLSARQQKAAYRGAVEYGRKTLDSYLKQFSVSRRTLLDVLIAETDYFQSAVQLLTAGANETIAAYRILALEGTVQIPRTSNGHGYPDDYGPLKKPLVFPEVKHLILSTSPFFSSIPGSRSTQKGSPEQLKNTVGTGSEKKEKNAAPLKTKTTQLCSMKIGPCINRRELNQADAILRKYGFDIRLISGIGPVRFIRLREGVYPAEKAYTRLRELRKKVPAFAMPEGGKLAIYVGSFRKVENAVHHTELLAQKGITVTPVVVQIKKRGTVLLVQKVDRQTGEKVAEQMSTLGLTAKLMNPSPSYAIARMQ